MPSERDYVQTRTKQDRIARLRRRLDQLPPGSSPEIVAFLKGVLDLLEDEL